MILHLIHLLIADTNVSVVSKDFKGEKSVHIKVNGVSFRESNSASHFTSLLNGDQLLKEEEYVSREQILSSKIKYTFRKGLSLKEPEKQTGSHYL